MGEFKNLKTMKEILEESASILGELIELDDKEETEEVSKEIESLAGRFVIKMMELQALKL